MSCLHCHEPTKKNEKFCCPGCATAYQIINKQGLSNYYQARALDSNKPSLKPEEHNHFEINDFVIENEAGNFELNLLVKGLHCAACIWLIETILGKENNVETARINYSTERLKLVWKGQKSQGTKLIKLVESLGYQLVPYSFNKSAEQDSKILLKYIAVSGFAAGNIMLLSVSLWSSSSAEMGIFTRQFLHFISALIALPTIIYAARPFFSSAFKALKAKRTNMDVPISLALVLATIISLVETFKAGEDTYFDSALMLIFFLLIGRFLDAKVKEKAKFNADELLAVFSGTARIKQGKKNIFIAINKLKPGMIALIAKGEKVPADGILESKNAEFDDHLISGETIPKNYSKGDMVYAGMINLHDQINVKITKNTHSSLISQILEIIEKAESEKSKYIGLAEVAAKFYTPIVHSLALFTFLLWFLWFNVGFNTAILYATAVLIITCPCALGLAVPTVQTLANSLLLKNGIILKSGKALEKLAHIRNIIFDKTGTLTVGKLSLISKSKKSNLQLAASLCTGSIHPIAKALSNSFTGEIIDVKTTEKPGIGLFAKWQGKNIFLGRDDKEENEISAKLTINDELKEQFIFSDSLRPDARNIISKLKNDYQLEMLSGDKEAVVKQTAKLLGIANYKSAQLPLDKLSRLEELDKNGHKTLMVGDGLNDIASQSAAYVSMAPATSIDLAQKNADLVFQGEKLEPVLVSLQIAKLANRLIKQNLWLAVIYNICVLPLAISGQVTPLIAAVAMSSSSIIVTLNSLRLKKWKS